MDHTQLVIDNIKLANAIQAYAMNLHILNLVEDMDDEYEADALLNRWLSIGVPDEATLLDCINYYGEPEDFKELTMDYLDCLKDYNLSADYSTEKQFIKTFIVAKI